MYRQLHEVLMPLVVRHAGQQVDLLTMETETVLYLEDSAGNQISIRIHAEDLDKLVSFAVVDASSAEVPSQPQRQPAQPRQVRQSRPEPEPQPYIDDKDDEMWSSDSWVARKRDKTTLFGEDDGTLTDT